MYIYYSLQETTQKRGTAEEPAAFLIELLDEKRASDKARCVEQLKADGDAAFFGGDAAIVSDDGTPPTSFQAFLAASAAKGQTHVALIFGDGDTTDKSYDKFDELSALADRVALVYVPWSLYSDECSHDPFLSRFGHAFAEGALDDSARANLKVLKGHSKGEESGNVHPRPFVIECGETPKTADIRPKVGDRVRVRLGVANPTYGWGSVEHGDVGILTQIDKNGDCKVDFPQQSGWAGKLSEMEKVQAFSLNAEDAEDDEEAEDTEDGEEAEEGGEDDESVEAADGGFASSLRSKSIIRCCVRYFPGPASMSAIAIGIGVPARADWLTGLGVLLWPVIAYLLVVQLLRARFWKACQVVFLNI